MKSLSVRKPTANVLFFLKERKNARLKAANQILTDGVADLILLGNPDEINACATEWGLGNISKATIIDPENNPKKRVCAMQNP